MEAELASEALPFIKNQMIDKVQKKEKIMSVTQIHICHYSLQYYQNFTNNS